MFLLSLLLFLNRILASSDKRSWDVIGDKSKNTEDACHDFIELQRPVKTKYIKIENVSVPDGKFSVFDLRVFGKKKGRAPVKIDNFRVGRNEPDKRIARLEWTKDNNATGYIVNYGTDENKLYTSVMVYQDNSLTLTGLNKGVLYYCSTDSFNESGITRGTEILKE
jgi:xylan 1,4-beta-xylosidase